MKELIISKTDTLEFRSWLERKGYILRDSKVPIGTGRKPEPTSPELNKLWKEFERECF